MFSNGVNICVTYWCEFTGWDSGKEMGPVILVAFVCVGMHAWFYFYAPYCVCVSYVQCLQKLELLFLIVGQLNPLSFIDEVSFYVISLWYLCILWFDSLTQSYSAAWCRLSRKFKSMDKQNTAEIFCSENRQIIKQTWLWISLYKVEFAEFRAYTTQSAWTRKRRVFS